MIAFITSIGEPTTELCKWALERNGFNVGVIQNVETTLAHKLKYIYEVAEDDFVRVDADVIVNKGFTVDLIEKWIAIDGQDSWWTQFITYDWYKQDTTHGGIQLIRKEALPALRLNINKFAKAERPESQMFRLEEFHNPRRGDTFEGQIMGLHGYGQPNLESVKETKARRRQLDNYDFELAERLNNL